MFLTSAPIYCTMDQSTSSLHSMTDEEDNRVLKKRPRPVMSCLDCRKKKLKCDRLLPCHQCKKSGRTARCTYAAQENSMEPQDEHLPSVRKKVRLNDPSHPEEGQEPGSDEVTARGRNNINPLITAEVVAEVRDLKTRVVELERLLSKKHHCLALGSPTDEDRAIPQSSVHRDPVSASYDSQTSILGMLFTKGNRSQYHASDRELPILSKFEEAMQVLRGVSKEPTVAFVMKEVKSARRLQATQLKSAEVHPVDRFSSIYASMMAALPPRHICEKLASIYFTCSESLLKILHRPTFSRDLEAFWSGGLHGLHSAVDDAILPQLVGVVLIASSLGIDEGTTTDSWSTDSLYAISKAWNNSLNSKSRLQLSTLQTQCLLLFARKMRPFEVGLLQSDSSALVRSAMKMGLHIDSRNFPKLSMFEGELRRNVWYTIVELDMQISYMSGGRPMVREGDFDTSPSAALDDDETFEGLVDPPSVHMDKFGIPRDLDVDAERHFYAILGTHIKHRLKASDFVNQVDRIFTFEEALEQGRQLEIITERLRDKLANFTVLRIGRLKLSESDILNSVLVYVYTLRPLLTIYRQYSLRESKNSAARLMEKSCVESSMDILSFLDLLKSIQHGEGHRSNALNIFHVLCKVDIMQAALTICLAAQRMDEETSARRDFRSISGNQIWSRTDLIAQVHTAVAGLIERTHEPIHDIREPLCLAVVAQYLLHIDSPNLREVKMRTGAYETINSYLESLRQSPASSLFGVGFKFKLVRIVHGFLSA